MQLYISILNEGDDVADLYGFDYKKTDLDH